MSIWSRYDGYQSTLSSVLLKLFCRHYQATPPDSVEICSGPNCLCQCSPADALPLSDNDVTIMATSVFVMFSSQLRVERVHGWKMRLKADVLPPSHLEAKTAVLGHPHLHSFRPLSQGPVPAVQRSLIPPPPHIPNYYRLAVISTWLLFDY